MDDQYETLPQSSGTRHTPHHTAGRHLHREQLKFQLENVNPRLCQASCVLLWIGAAELGREPWEVKGPGRWRAVALALKCLLELCTVFSAPSIFLLSASHEMGVEMQRLLFPAAGKQAGVPGALRLAACAGCAVLCYASPQSAVPQLQGGHQGHTIYFLPSRISMENTPCTTPLFFRKCLLYVGLCLCRQKVQEALD